MIDGNLAVMFECVRKGGSKGSEAKVEKIIMEGESFGASSMKEHSVVVPLSRLTTYFVA